MAQQSFSHQNTPQIVTRTADWPPLSESPTSGPIRRGYGIMWHETCLRTRQPHGGPALTGQQHRGFAGAFTRREATGLQKAKKTVECWPLGICCSSICPESSPLGNPPSLIPCNSGDYGLPVKHSSHSLPPQLSRESAPQKGAPRWRTQSCVPQRVMLWVLHPAPKRLPRAPAVGTQANLGSCLCPPGPCQ